MRLPLLALLLVTPAFAADPPAKPRKVKAAVKDDASPLIGEWLRKSNDVTVTLKITEKRLFVTVVDPTPSGARSCVNLSADYAVGPDGRVFGVITGVDCKIAWSNGDTLGAAAGGKPKGSNSFYKALEGVPFAFRARIDGDALTAGELRAEGLKGQPEVLALTGKFERGAATAKGVPQQPVTPVRYYDEYPNWQRTRIIPPEELPPIPIVPLRTGELPPDPNMPPLPDKIPPITILPLREEAPKPRGATQAERPDSGMTLPSPRHLKHEPLTIPPELARRIEDENAREFSRYAYDIARRSWAREEAPKPRPVSAPAPMYFPIPSPGSR